MYQKQMLYREWFVVFLTLLFGLFFFIVARPFSLPAAVRTVQEVKKGENSLIRVEVLGAVARPGVYEVEVGLPMRELLKKAGLLKEADGSALYKKKLLQQSCQIQVPLKKNKKKEAKKSEVR